MKYFITFAILFLSSIAHASDDVVTNKITDNVYSIYIDYYTSLVVVGNDGVLLTDPATPYRAERLKKAVFQITDLPVTHIVLTHEHYDHVGGTGHFKDAKIIVQEKAIPIFGLDVTGSVPKVVHETFERAYSVTMGKTKVDVLHFGFPSDGVANSVIHLPYEKLVYSADLYEDNEIVSREYIDAFNSLGARQMLNELVALKPKYAIASHSSNADVQDLYTAADFFNDLYDAILPGLMKAMESGYPAVMQFSDKFPKELKLKKYEKIKNYDHLYRHSERMIASILHGG
jgi:L-ascorbate metabolism protein UlaG (beta-lactamase superfamily)